MPNKKKLMDDQRLYQWGQQLQKTADKWLAKGHISRVDYRDISWNALQAMRPRDCVKLTGV